MTDRIKKVIVTGDAGFICSATIAALQNCGHEIYVIDNLSFGSRKLIEIPDSHFFKIDILDGLLTDMPTIVCRFFNAMLILCLNRCQMNVTQDLDQSNRLSLVPSQNYVL